MINKIKSIIKAHRAYTDGYYVGNMEAQAKLATQKSWEQYLTSYHYAHWGGACMRGECDKCKSMPKRGIE